MYVAASKYRGLRAYQNKPTRNWSTLCWEDQSGNYIEIDDKVFTELTWDDEPVEVKLVAINPILKTICHKCSKEIKYNCSDIKTYCDYQPWSGYEEEWNYVKCPNCGADIKV